MLTYCASGAADVPGSPKGPFKGKGANPSVSRSIKEVRQRLATLDDSRNTLTEQGEAMVREFRNQFPDAPAYLTRYADRTLNDYRWRRSSARRWREGRPPRVNVTLDLTSADGLAMLESLPVAVRKVWVGYERRRIDLNLALALVNYERYRLRDWLARIEILRGIGRNSGNDRV